MNKSKSLNSYFKSIKDLNPLTKDQEKELAKRIKVGDRSAINALVEHNLKIVITIANKNIGRGIDVDDLIQQGNIGLYEAALRFDPDYGIRFASFARTRVIKMMNELIDTCGRLVRIPVNQEYQRYLDIKEGKDVECLKPVYLDRPLNDDGSITLLSRINIKSSSENLDEEFKALNLAVNSLSEKERRVITWFFGLEGNKKITQIEIGKKLGVTNVTVGNIKKRALSKLKKSYNLNL